MTKKSTWFGGAVLCVFPALIFLRAGGDLPFVWILVLSLLVVCGLWAIVSDIFGLGADSGWTWLVGAIVGLGFAGFAFLLACNETDFRGGIPFIPALWNQIAARLLFALGGLIALLAGAAFLRKAIQQFRQ
jgi:hypothetical protein